MLLHGARRRKRIPGRNAATIIAGSRIILKINQFKKHCPQELKHAGIHTPI